MANEQYLFPFQLDAFNHDKSTLAFLNAIVRGGICCGYEKINNVDNTDVKSLTLPAGAISALISVEAGGGQANANAVIRFREDNVAPTITDGIPIGNYGTYEIKNEENLGNFKFISPEAIVQTIHVLYYK